MVETPSPLAIEEYRALRATIRQRGTARLVIAAFTFVAWGGLAVAVQALFTAPVTTLVPLLVLGAGFEVVFALHSGVERIGRYLQVYYEGDPAAVPSWENVVMRLGRQSAQPSSHLDPLFAGTFILAALLNLVPAALMSFGVGPTVAEIPVEIVVYGLLHLVFILRVLQARRFSGLQRQSDLALFQQDRSTGHSTR